MGVWSVGSLVCCIFAITFCSGTCALSLPGQTLELRDDVQFRSMNVNVDGALPVVLWHGMGDSCCASYSIGGVSKYISDELGTHPPPLPPFSKIDSHSTKTTQWHNFMTRDLDDIAGVFVHSISTGENAARDVASTYWGNVNDQVRCKQSSHSYAPMHKQESDILLRQ